MNILHFSVAMSRCYSKHTIEPLPQQQKLDHSYRFIRR